jgi:hypothetical protein
MCQLSKREILLLTNYSIFCLGLLLIAREKLRAVSIYRVRVRTGGWMHKPPVTFGRGLVPALAGERLLLVIGNPIAILPIHDSLASPASH